MQKHNPATKLARRLSRARKFSVLYFTVLFAWDVCDQTSSWWFWQYTGDVGASLVGYSELWVQRCKIGSGDHRPSS